MLVGVYAANGNRKLRWGPQKGNEEEGEEDEEAVLDIVAGVRVGLYPTGPNREGG